MVKVRLSALVAAACVAIASIGVAATQAAQRAYGAFWSIAAFFVRSIAYPQTWLTPRLAGGHPLYDPIGSYEGPNDSFVRHEANVSRRAADRHT